MFQIQTERLTLRTWKASDINKMLEVNMDEEVMKYFPSTQGEEKTRSFIQRMNKQFEEKEYCYFAAEVSKTKDFIGFIGMSYQTYDAPHTPFVDIGWRLKQSTWGNGYATEGAKACLKYAFEYLKLENVYSVASLNNLPSENVMQKIGMDKVLEFEHPALLETPLLKHCMMYHIAK